MVSFEEVAERIGTEASIVGSTATFSYPDGELILEAADDRVIAEYRHRSGLRGRSTCEGADEDSAVIAANAAKQNMKAAAAWMLKMRSAGAIPSITEDGDISIGGMIVKVVDSQRIGRVMMESLSEALDEARRAYEDGIPSEPSRSIVGMVSEARRKKLPMVVKRAIDLAVASVSAELDVVKNKSEQMKDASDITLELWNDWEVDIVYQEHENNLRLCVRAPDPDHSGIIVLDKYLPLTSAQIFGKVAASMMDQINAASQKIFDAIRMMRDYAWATNENEYDVHFSYVNVCYVYMTKRNTKRRFYLNFDASGSLWIRATEYLDEPSLSTPKVPTAAQLFEQFKELINMDDEEFNAAINGRRLDEDDERKVKFGAFMRDLKANVEEEFDVKEFVHTWNDELNVRLKSKILLRFRHHANMEFDVRAERRIDDDNAKPPVPVMVILKNPSILGMMRTAHLAVDALEASFEKISELWKMLADLPEIVRSSHDARRLSFYGNSYRSYGVFFNKSGMLSVKIVNDPNMVIATLPAVATPEEVMVQLIRAKEMTDDQLRDWVQLRD